MKKSKYQTIDEALKENSNVEIIETKNVNSFGDSPPTSYNSMDQFYPPSPQQGIIYTISPKGGLYETKDLNEFMFNLIPKDLFSNKVDVAKEHKNVRFVRGGDGNGSASSDINLGRLFFYENFGKVKDIATKMIKINDPYSGKDLKNKKISFSTESNLLRIINLNILPFASKRLWNEITNGKIGNFYVYGPKLDERHLHSDQTVVLLSPYHFLKHNPELKDNQNFIKWVEAAGKRKQLEEKGLI